MEAARHAPFILSAYAVTFVVIAGLILRAILDHRGARRDLARLGREDGA
jgi:heme exporter protein CcmD